MFGITRYLAVIVMVLVISQGLIYAATYYVDVTNGNNDYDGLSPLTAWRTIGKANQELQAGDTVYIREGTYKETIRPTNSGSPGNYITYMSYPGEEATITGVTDGVNLNERSFIVIDGLRIISVGSHGITVYNAHYKYNTGLLFRGCPILGYD